MTTKQLLQTQLETLTRDAERVVDNLTHSSYVEPEEGSAHDEWEEENMEGVAILEELNQEIELVNDLLTNYIK